MTKLVETNINIGEMGGFLAYPENAKQGETPGIVLIQEIFGVNATMREIARTLAGEGFAVLCPDLFWRLAPGIELDDRKPEELQQAFDLFGKFDIDGGAKDVGRALAFIKDHEICSGRAGLLGYCLGGRLAFLGACRAKPDAAVGYYAVGLDVLLPEADRLACPLLLHIAEEDDFVPKPVQQQARDALGGNKQVELAFWPNCGHGFARQGGDHYNAEAAQKADGQSLAFLKKALK